MQKLIALLLGVYFGVLMVKSEVASWFRIQKMFHFEEAHMYLTMSSALAVGLISVWLIKKLHVKTVGGTEPALKNKPFTKGTVVGGVLFGMGWAITGACPGPIYAQVGSGEGMALISFVGAFLGAYLYALLRPRLPH